MAEHLQISIVTATLNRAQFIRDAIESVLAQSYPDVEHIIVDGGSTDNTLEILKQYSHLRWISEQDGGMYEAINKGIRMANGNVIGLLNSDDTYAPAVFPDVANAFLLDEELFAIVGGAGIYREAEQSSGVVRMHSWINWDDDDEKWKRLTGSGLVTNAWFFRRALFDRIGFFDETYRVSADREFLLRVGFSKLKVSPLQRQVYCYRYHDESLTMNPKSSLEPERARVRIRTLREGMHIAEKFLLSGQVPVRAKPYLRYWHSHRAYQLAATAFFQRDWQAAFQAMSAGLKFDAFWPFMIVDWGGKRFMKSLRRTR